MMDKQTPVFIIGGSRTGSEMLKTMLSASGELDFVDELFLLCPRWLHRDLDSYIRARVGALSAPGAVDRLVDLCYSREPFGWFFSKGIDELDKDILREELSKRDLTLRSVFLAIMVAHAKIRRKRGIGAKFPLHYSRADRLLMWFPDARIIHTTRHPKATYASQAAKYIRDEKNPVLRNYMRFKQFVHINIQISWTARIHKQLAHLPNYRLVRYEDVVLNAEEELRGICDFLGVDFSAAMMEPNQYGSSFDKIGGSRGIDSSSLERWRQSIHPLTSNVIDVLHPFAPRIFGYER